MYAAPRKRTEIKTEPGVFYAFFLLNRVVSITFSDVFSIIHMRRVKTTLNMKVFLSLKVRQISYH
jgi:hypothetical protein